MTRVAQLRRADGVRLRLQVRMRELIQLGEAAAIALGLFEQTPNLADPRGEEGAQPIDAVDDECTPDAGRLSDPAEVELAMLEPDQIEARGPGSMRTVLRPGRGLGEKQLSDRLWRLLFELVTTQGLERPAAMRGAGDVRPKQYFDSDTDVDLEAREAMELADASKKGRASWRNKGP